MPRLQGVECVQFAGIQPNEVTDLAQVQDHVIIADAEL
jgi:hypothetical protein